MRNSIVLLALVLPLLAMSLASDARASCYDPRVCFQEICQRPGNVVELTILSRPEAALELMRLSVDAVHVVDADAFESPAVGSIVELPIYDGELEVGDRLVALADDLSDVSWAVFALSDSGAVTCVGAAGAGSLTVAELTSVVTSGRCDKVPVPQVRPCDDEGECALGADGSLLLGLAMLVMLAMRRRAGPFRVC